MASRGRTAEGGCTITWLDITDSKKTQARAQAIANDAMEALEEGFALFDAELSFLFCNRKYAEYVLGGQEFVPRAGAPVGDLARSLYDRRIYRLADGTTYDDYVAQVETMAVDYRKNVELVRQDGRIIEASSHETELGGYLVTARDVTEKRESERRELAAVTDAMQALGDGIALYDPQFNFVMGNDRFFDMWFTQTGIAPASPGENLSEVLRRIIDADYIDVPQDMPRQKYIDQLLQRAKAFEKNLPLPSKDRIYSCSSHQTGLGGYLLECKDVTEQLLAEEERRESEARALAKVTDTIETLDIGLALLDAELNFVFGNQMLNNMFHRRVPPPEAGEPMADIARRLVDGKFYKLPDGFDPVQAAARVVRRVVELDANFDTFANDGRIFRGSANRTKEGGYLLSFADITDQRQAESELERRREHAYQNEKLSAMGELLAGVAHELNNPLSIVVGYSMMMQGAVKDPKLRRQVDNIAQAADRCSRIVKAFLSMARQKPVEMRRCSLNELMMAAVDMVGHRLRAAGIDVEIDLDPDLPDVEADEDQIIQVFTNLLVNAEQALCDQPAPRQLQLRSFYDKRAGKAVARIADNGPGIAPDVLPRIFEPFYTTKDVGTGTGIGLAFCHRILASHNGRLTARSKPGEGARFYIRLGLCEHEDPAIGLPDAVPDAAAGRILVVDDEPVVAELIGDVLSDAGFDVQIQHDAFIALEVLKSRSFDAILSDIKMPGLDGPGFFHAIQDFDPALALRTGFVTGDTLSRSVAAFLNGTGQPHLEKPITPAELLLLVGDLMHVRSD